MPKYLFQGTYTLEGARGLLSRGGTARRDAVQRAIEGLGGKLESFYFAFGDTDVCGVFEFPDNVSAASLSLIVNSAGGAQVKAIPLITPEELDQATKKATTYRPPGA